MMVMTAKLDLKKVILVIVGVAALALSLILLLGHGQTQSTTVSVSGNDARVKFLEDFGWEVTPSPKESSQVKIPQEDSQVYQRYNALQISQGYDLRSYAGKKVMRYVYELKNYPGTQDPAYATVLVYKNNIIGGDVTLSGARGTIHSFRMPQKTRELPQATAPMEAETQPETVIPTT